MSVYGYSVSKGKTNFNIHFSSYQVNSWTGSNKYDATYTVDLRGHIDVSDFHKSYNVYLFLESENFGDGSLYPETAYACHLAIGSSFINASSFREKNTPHFIISKYYYNTAAAALYVALKAGQNDNAPVTINNAFGLDSVSIRIFDLNGQTTLVSGANYQFILRFEEV